MLRVTLYTEDKEVVVCGDRKDSVQYTTNYIQEVCKGRLGNCRLDHGIWEQKVFVEKKLDMIEKIACIMGAGYVELVPLEG